MFNFFKRKPKQQDVNESGKIQILFEYDSSDDTLSSEVFFVSNSKNDDLIITQKLSELFTLLKTGKLNPIAYESLVAFTKRIGKPELAREVLIRCHFATNNNTVESPVVSARTAFPIHRNFHD